MTTIITKFGRSSYNRPMMIIYTFGIFQDKLDKVLSVVNIFKTYIHHIIVFRKDSFQNHLVHI